MNTTRRTLGTGLMKTAWRNRSRRSGERSIASIGLLAMAFHAHALGPGTVEDFSYVSMRC
jgi:hypothetical protein